MSVKTAVNWS